jgi:hypothetical protein
MIGVTLRAVSLRLPTLQPTVKCRDLDDYVTAAEDDTPAQMSTSPVKSACGLEWRVTEAERVQRS